MSDNKKKSPDLGKILAGTLGQFAGNFNEAARLAGIYLSLSGDPIKIMEVGQLINLYLQKNINAKDFYDRMSCQGYDKTTTDNIIKANKQYLSPHEYAILLQRGMITKEKFHLLMDSMNMSDDEFMIKDLNQFYPGVQDLVRFAVREAYTPETEAKFGQLQEIPKIFLTEALKAGVPEEQAKHFWSAHWELPSLTLGFEMFHRTTTEKIDNDCDEIKLPSGGTVYNVIGKKTLNLLAKSQDVMPFWRDKITAVSYNPLTRVDIRRMYSLGAIDEDKVFRSYLDEGYNEENALALTDFVVKEYSQEMHGITRAMLTKAYHEDILTEKEFREQLHGLKMTEKTIDFYVSLADYEKLMDRIKTLVESLSIQVQDGSITIDEFRNKLANEDVPATFIDQQVIKVSQKRSIKTKLVPLEDVKRWFKNAMIDEINFRQRLKILGYTQVDIDLYTHEIKGGK